MATALFIDDTYISRVFGPKMDYLKLRNHLERKLDDKIDEAYLFTVDIDPEPAQKRKNMLSHLPPKGPGLRVKTCESHAKPLYWAKALGGEPVMHPERKNLQYEIRTHKSVDIALTYHMVRSYYKRGWDKLVLAICDAEFQEPVENLVEGEGVDLYLIGSLTSMADQLRPYARKIFEVDKEPLRSSLTLGSRKRI